MAGAVRSTTVNRVSEMTHLVGIKQGLTPQLTGFDPVTGPIYDPHAPPVRYVDNLRTAFVVVEAYASRGIWIILNDIATIHFARWVILPGDQQLLFTSNFDGSWEQYIHDFVTIANSGKPSKDNASGAKWMDLIWGNCEAYTGTDDFEAFLGWIQSLMIETTLFFPTISDVTVRDISWLRQFRRIFGEFDEAALGVDRSQWPPGLLTAYDQMKREINQIDVTDA